MNATSNAEKYAYHETQSGLDQAMVDCMADAVIIGAQKPYDEKNIIVALVRSRYSASIIEKHINQVMLKVCAA